MADKIREKCEQEADKILGWHLTKEAILERMADALDPLYRRIEELAERETKISKARDHFKALHMDWIKVDVQQRKQIENQFEQISTLQAKNQELEKQIGNFEFLTGASRKDVRYSANRIANLESQLAKASAALESLRNLFENARKHGTHWSFTKLENLIIDIDKTLKEIESEK